MEKLKGKVRQLAIWFVVLAVVILVDIAGASGAKSPLDVGTPLVSLDVADLSFGKLVSWPNQGSLGGSFGPSVYSGADLPAVEEINGRKAVVFSPEDRKTFKVDVLESSFAAPVGITGDHAWTVSVVAFTPSIDFSETIVSWTEPDMDNGAAHVVRMGYKREQGIPGIGTIWGSDVAGGNAKANVRRNANGKVKNSTNGKVVGKSNEVLLAFSKVPDLSKWHHIAWVYKGPDGGSLADVYVDGKLNNSVSLGDIKLQEGSKITVGACRDYDRAWVKAASSQSSNSPALHVLMKPFSGALSKIEIYDKALTGGEIVKVMARGYWPELTRLESDMSEIERAFEEETLDTVKALVVQKRALWQGLSKKYPDMHVWIDAVEPEINYRLAKSKESAGVDKEEVIQAYKDAVHSSRQGYVLSWLFENLTPGEFKNVIKSTIYNSNNNWSSLKKVAANFELNGNWSAFKLYLDVLFDTSQEPQTLARTIADESIRDGKWKEQYREYCRRRSGLAQYACEQDCLTVEKYVVREDFTNALTAYRGIIKQYGPGEQRSRLDLKIIECLFKTGDHSATISELTRFLSENKSLYRDLSRQALLLKGRSYIQLSEIDKALNEFLTLAVEYPESNQAPESCFFMGYCYMQQHKFKEAMEAFSLVEKDYPESSYSEKARLYFARIESMTQ